MLYIFAHNNTRAHISKTESKHTQGNCLFEKSRNVETTGHRRTPGQDKQKTRAATQTQTQAAIATPIPAGEKTNTQS